MTLTRRSFMQLCGTAVLWLAVPGFSAGRTAQIPILLYCDLSDSSGEPGAIPPGLFAAEMEWLYEEGYHAVSFTDLDSFRTDAERIVILVFDGGYASFMDHGFPLLMEYGFQATVNVLGKYAGSFIHGNDPRLSWDECRFLLESKIITIGCNGYDTLQRPFLKQDVAAAPSAVKKDLAAFQSIFEKETRKKAEILSWPYGRADRGGIAAAKRAGFKYIIMSGPGSGAGGNGEIPGTTIDGEIDLKSFRRLIESRL